MSIRIENPLSQNSNHRSEAERIYQQQVSQLQSIWAKLDSLLMTNNVMDANSTRIACGNLRALPAAERAQYVEQIWGAMYRDRCQPLLSQLISVEEAIAHAAKPVKR